MKHLADVIIVIFFVVLFLFKDQIINYVDSITNESPCVQSQNHEAGTKDEK